MSRFELFWRYPAQAALFFFGLVNGGVMLRGYDTGTWALLVGALAEVWMLERPFLPILGWAALAIVIASQTLRWWCIASLGRQWNTRVIVVPGLPLVSRGPYRLLRHPNYVAVVLEGAALPLVHSAWATAAGFTVLNAALLTRRIQVENRALATVAGKAAALR